MPRPAWLFAGAEKSGSLTQTRGRAGTLDPPGQGDDCRCSRPTRGRKDRRQRRANEVSSRDLIFCRSTEFSNARCVFDRFLSLRTTHIGYDSDLIANGRSSWVWNVLETGRSTPAPSNGKRAPTVAAKVRRRAAPARDARARAGSGPLAASRKIFVKLVVPSRAGLPGGDHVN